MFLDIDSRNDSVSVSRERMVATFLLTCSGSIFMPSSAVSSQSSSACCVDSSSIFALYCMIVILITSFLFSSFPVCHHQCRETVPGRQRSLSAVSAINYSCLKGDIMIEEDFSNLHMTGKEIFALRRMSFHFHVKCNKTVKNYLFDIVNFAIALAALIISVMKQ